MQPKDTEEQHAIYISGTRDAVNNWDVKFVRALFTDDGDKDEVLTADKEYKMMFAFGGTDYLA